MSARKPYPSDLTALQWDNIAHLFPGAHRRPGSPGRTRTYDRKDVVDAVFYLARTGAGWRSLPHDFPPWKTVSYYFYTWRDAGVWERLHDTLRRDVRKLLGRYRRLSKDYEANPHSSETWIYVSAIHRMSRFALPERNRDDYLLRRPRRKRNLEI